LSYEETIARFPPNIRKRYGEAWETLKKRPLNRRDARIASFVKAEKFNPLEKVNPDPRMIQARGVEYGLELARYLKPIEKYLYAMKGPTGLRMLAKGLNQRGRGALLAEKLRRFRRPVVFSLDASRWDKHVAADVLRIEHSVYNAIMRDPLLQRLLEWQVTNDCRTNNGVKYKVHGGRMSGDMNTALGNCLLMVLMVHAAMEDHPGMWDLMDDGDDCLLIVEEEEFERVRARLPSTFLTFGQELKVENVARDLRDVSFCQCRVVVTPSGPVMVRDWRKVLSQAACGVKHWGNPLLVRPLLTTIGHCELALAEGMPILQEFALALIRNGNGQLPRKLLTDPSMEARLRIALGRSNVTLDDLLAVRPMPIDPATRVEFERTWGVTTVEQLHIEEILRGWTVGSVIAKEYPVEWEADWNSRVALENELPTI
jgi:hypothetical protein